MIGHYVQRFFTSLSRRPPSTADEQWAATLLAPRELDLFRRLSATDRRHLIHGARLVERDLGPDADPVWVKAALLHDVGKFGAGLGVFGRVVATVLAMFLGDARVRSWAGEAGWRGRLGSYRAHDEIGAAEIRAAGGPEAAAVWSELHHRPEQLSQSGIPPDVVTILDAADR